MKVFFSNCLDSLSEQLAKSLDEDLRQSAKEDLRFKRPQMIIESPESRAYVQMRLAQIQGIWANFDISPSLKSWVSKKYYFQADKNLLLSKNLIISLLLNRSSTAIDGIKLSQIIARAERFEACFLREPQRIEKARNRRENDDILASEIVAICEELKAEYALECILPHDIIRNRYFFDSFEQGSRLYIFDPSPYSAVDLLCLQALARRIEIIIFAFSPCASYWGDIETSVRRLPQSKLRCNDSMSFDGEDPFWTQEFSNELGDGHFLLERCGRISSELFRAFFLEEELETIGVYKVGPEGIQSNLAKIQASALVLQPPSKLQMDDSLHICVFNDIDAACESVAMAISELDFEGLDLCLEDLVVLLPHALIDSYGPKLSMVFKRYEIPFDMSDLDLSHVGPVVEAFDAFVALLVDRPSRAKVLDFLLHSAICSPEFENISDEIIKCVHRLGIFENRPKTLEKDYLKEELAFGWRQGMARLSLSLTHSNDIIEDIDLPYIDSKDQFAILAWFGLVDKLLGELEDLKSQICGLNKWRIDLLKLFDTWLRQDLYARDDALQSIRESITGRWPEELGNVAYDFSQAIAIFKMTSIGIREDRYSTPLSCGVQIRRLNPIVFGARFIYMLGMEDEAFPSEQKMGGDPDRFSSYEVDAHAFLKWFMQCRDALYLSAVVPESKDIERDEAMIRARLVPFVADLADVFDDLKLSESLSESDKMRAQEAYFSAIKELRHVVHVRDGRWLSGEWDFVKREKEQVVAVLGQREERKDEALENAAYEVHEMSWCGLADLLVGPSDAYRKYRLGINEYLPMTVDVQRGLALEPIEKNDLEYEMRYLVDALIKSSIAFKDGVRFEGFRELYERAGRRFRDRGFYPAAVFADIQKDKDELLARTIFSTFDSLGLVPKKFLTYVFQGDARQSELDVSTGDDTSFPTEIVGISYTHCSPQTEYVLKGTLPLILEDIEGELFFVFLDCLNSSGMKARDQIRIGFAALFLMALAYPVPKMLIFINAKGEMRGTDLALSQWDAKKAIAFLAEHIDFFDGGLHDLCLEEFKLKDGIQLSDLKNSLQHRFAVSEPAHRASFEAWKERIESQFYDDLLGICPTLQKI